MHKVECQANELLVEITVVWNPLIRRPLRLFKFSFLRDTYWKEHDQTARGRYRLGEKKVRNEGGKDLQGL